MSGESKGKRRPRKPATPKAQEGGPPEGADRRPRWSADLRDKIAVIVAVAILIPIVVFTFLNFYRSGEPEQQSAAPTTAGPAGPPRAAIVDQLSLTQPNTAFVETVTDLLEQAGYAVDYYPGEEVTVEFYRHLPTLGHKLIIFRVHSAQGRGEDGQLADWVTLFTADSYDATWYVSEQAEHRLSRVSYQKEGSKYFGIMPGFIKSSMEADFPGTTIILMGCDGLRSDKIAEAFVEKGAKAVVAWDGLVSSAHTDAATERLLHYLVTEGLTLQEAIAQTMAEVGPDPTYDSTTLLLYPP
jgi:hypothetical protein